jgi:hypothetical protein
MKRSFVFGKQAHTIALSTISRLVWVIPMLVLAFSLPIIAQTSLSTVRGAVTDQFGAAVPGSQVRLRDVLTNIVVRTVITDDHGNYEIPDVIGGNYDLSVSRSGFETYIGTGISVASNEAKRVDVTLRIGSTTTQVTVSGAATVIQTEGGDLGATFNAQKHYDTLPVPGGFGPAPTNVLATLPLLQFDRENSLDATVSGQGGNQFDMSIDGVLEEDIYAQSINMEAADEVRVLGVNNSAEESRIATYDVVTKRGSNQFHGDGAYYLRNSAVGARGYFDITKQPIIYNAYKAEAAGPIIKDKAFFYGLYYGIHISQSTSYLTSAPTVDMRTGDFSQLLGLSSPVSIRDPQTGVLFPGNIIPSARIATVSNTTQGNYIPSPNLGGPGALTNNYTFVHPFPGDKFGQRAFVGRSDYMISSKDSIFGRISYAMAPYVLPGDYPLLKWTRVRNSYSWAANETHIFSPNLLNSFEFGGNWDEYNDGSAVAGVTPLNGAAVVSAIGVQGVNPADLSAMGFPEMNISGLPVLTIEAGGHYVPNSDFSYTDGLTWERGRHVANFGAQIRTYSDFNGQVPTGTYGSFAFDGRFTGYPYADFLLGLPGTSTRLEPIVGRTQRADELGFYATDTFKLTPRLTLNYGIRWDYFGSPTYQDGLQYNWDPSTGNVIVAQSALAKIGPLYPKSISIVAGNPVPHPATNNFVPRVAGAYMINKNTVVRGGYGIFNEALGPYTLSTSQGQGPFEVSETYSNTFQNGQALFAFPNPFPPGQGGVPSQSVTGFPANMSDGIIQQYNLTLERQLHSVGLRTSYIGSSGSGLHYLINVDLPKPSVTPFSPSNLPYPQFVSANYQRSNGRSKYNALSVEAKRNVGDLTFDWNWTWASSLSNILNLENPYASLQWSHDAITPRHHVALVEMWAIPVGKGRRFGSNLPVGIDAVVGGWKLSWISYFETGQYFSPSFSGSDPSNTNTFGGLPDRICNGNLPPGQRSISGWFDTSCFVTPGAGSFGDSRANILEGPGLQTQNAGLTKDFPLFDQLHLQLSVLVSNVFNHPNFLNPSSNDVSVPGAGVINSTPDYYSAVGDGPRLVEGRLKISF